MAYRFKSVDAQPLRHRSHRKKALAHPLTPFLVLLFIAVAILGCGPDPNVTPNDQRTTVKQNSNKNNQLPAEQQPPFFWDHNRTVAKPVSTEPHFAGSESCQECHAAIYQQYMRHPMAQSIRKIGDQTPLEQYLQNPTFASAGYQYEIRSDANAPESPPSAVEHIERVTSSSGQTVLEQSIPIHYVVGSGSRGRSFLHQAGDRLFQSPITWYDEGSKAGSNRSFESSRISRRVRRSPARRNIHHWMSEHHSACSSADGNKSRSIRCWGRIYANRYLHTDPARWFGLSRSVPI